MEWRFNGYWVPGLTSCTGMAEIVETVLRESTGWLGRQKTIQQRQCWSWGKCFQICAQLPWITVWSSQRHMRKGLALREKDLPRVSGWVAGLQVVLSLPLGALLLSLSHTPWAQDTGDRSQRLQEPRWSCNFALSGICCNQPRCFPLVGKPFVTVWCLGEDSVGRSNEGCNVNDGSCMALMGAPRVGC